MDIRRNHWTFNSVGAHSSPMSFLFVSQTAEVAGAHPILSVALVTSARVIGKLPAMMREARLWDSMRRREGRLAKRS